VSDFVDESLPARYSRRFDKYDRTFIDTREFRVSSCIIALTPFFNRMVSTFAKVQNFAAIL